MLTQRAKNKLIDEINGEFDIIGKKMPIRSKSNTEVAAWEYFVASYLAKRAEDRRNEAKALAEEAGVIFDSNDADKQRPPGTEEAVFMGELVTVMLKVSKPRVLLDQKILAKSLVELGVSKNVIGAAMERASRDSKPGHQFTASLLTKEAADNGK